MTDLSALKPYLTKTPDEMEQFGVVHCGTRGPISFVSVLDDDGYLTLSLSKGRKKPSDANCTRFFEFLKQEPLFETPSITCRIFVMQAPEANA